MDLLRTAWRSRSTPADDMEESVFIIIRLRGSNIGRRSSSLAVTEAEERLIAWRHLSYWLFWMKYGLIGCRPLPLANIDFHSLVQLSVPLCFCRPLILSLPVPYLFTASYMLPLFLKKKRNDHQNARSFKDEDTRHVCSERGNKKTDREEDRARRRGMEWKTKRKWKRDGGVEGETDGGAEMKWKRDRAGNRGREGGVIIYQVFGCAWQRRKLISTLCVHQLHSQASQGIPLACLCEAAGGHTDTLTLRYPRTHCKTQLERARVRIILSLRQNKQTHKIMSKSDFGISASINSTMTAYRGDYR